MEYKEEIIELLKEYIDIKKNDKKKYEELFTKKALYEELINVINVNYEELINNRLNISLLLKIWQFIIHRLTCIIQNYFFTLHNL